MQKWSFLLISFWCSYQAMAQPAVRFNRLDMLDSTGSRYYSFSHIAKQELADRVTPNVLQHAPPQLDMYLYNYDADLETDLAECKDQVGELQKKNSTLSKEDFSKVWSQDLKACYLKFVSSLPVFIASFSVDGKEKLLLDSVEVTVFYIIRAQGIVESPDLVLSRDQIKSRFETLTVPSAPGSLNQRIGINQVDSRGFGFFFLLKPETLYLTKHVRDNYLLQLNFHFKDSKGKIYRTSTQPFVVSL